MDTVIVADILKSYYSNCDFEMVNYSIEPVIRLKPIGTEFATLTVKVLRKEQFSKQNFLVQILNNEESARKEFFVYNVLRKEIENCIFKPFFINDKVAVFENPFKNGYQQPPSLDEAHLKVALKSLAAFHSPTFVLEETDRSSSCNLSENEKDCSEECLKQVVTFVVNRVEEFLEEETKNALNAYAQEFFGLFNEGNRYKKVCSHGSLSIKTILFKYASGIPVDCKLISFSSMKKAPPAFDVLYLLATAEANLTKINDLDNLLEFYYSNLEEGVKRFNLELSTLLPIEEFEITSKHYFKAAKFLAKILEIYELALKDPTFSTSTRRMRNLFEDSKGVVVSKIRKLEEVLCDGTISLEDVRRVITQTLLCKDFRILKWKLDTMGEVKGFLGDHYTLLVAISVLGKEETFQYFVKCIPRLESQRRFAIDTGASFKEYAMFRRVIPAFRKKGIDLLDSCIPKCYLFRLNDVSIFEDLSVDGYRILPLRQSMDYEAVRLVVSLLAKMHAAIFIFEENMSEELGRSYRIGEEYREEFREAFYSSAKCCVELIESAKKGVKTQIDLFLEELDGLDVEALKELAGRCFEEMFFWVRPSKKYRNTLVHGDLWVNNILFKFEGEKVAGCKFIDFQSYRYNAPTMDLLLFLYCSTDRKFRQEYRAKVLDLYFGELKGNLGAYGVDIETILSYEDFLESCEELTPFCWANSCSLKHCVMLTPEQLREFFSKENRSYQFFYEDRSEMITEICSIDPEYRSILRECTLDLMDLFQNKNQVN